jgi:hypothetical protein
MRVAVITVSTTAALFTITAFETAPVPFSGSPVQAKSGPPRGPVRVAPSRPSAKPMVRQNVQTRVLKKPTVNVQKQFTAKPITKGITKQTVPLVKGIVPPNVGKGVTPAVVGKGIGPLTPGKGPLTVGKGIGPVNLKTLPTFKPVNNTAFLKGRVGVPVNVRPKLSLIKGPQLVMRPRFAPFLQRHWRHAFVWVAIAGIGFITIPELYYDRFYGYVSIDDPDYDAALLLLSTAALEEEEVVRAPMPVGTTYRYTARAAPPPRQVVAAPGPDANKACGFEPFVERKWNRSYVWVQIPEVGNVTVPETDYDRFYSFVSAEPPNYPTACSVLVEAAAADTVEVAVQMAPGASN